MLRSALAVYAGAFRGLPRDIWLLSLVTLINRAGTMVLPFLALYLTQDRGLSVARAGLLLGVYGLGAIAGSALGGWAADRIGASRALFVGLVASGAAFLALGAADGLTAITLALLAVSVISEGSRPPIMAATAHRAPAELRTRSFALVRLAVNLGVAIGPAVAGFLVLIDYKWIFIGDALTCWAGAVVLLWVFGWKRSAHETVPAPQVRARPPWRDGPYLGLMAMVFLTALVFFQVFTTLPLYFKEVYDLREDRIGLLLALNALLIVLFEMVLTHAAERFNPVRVIAWGSLFVSLGFGLLPFGSGIAWAALTIVIWTVGEMLGSPFTTAVVAHRAAPEQRGRYMGMYSMAFSVSMVVAPPAGTWVYERFGPDALWVSVGLLGVPIFALTLMLTRPLGRPADPLDFHPPGT